MISRGWEHIMCAIPHLNLLSTHKNFSSARVEDASGSSKRWPNVQGRRRNGLTILVFGLHQAGQAPYSMGRTPCQPTQKPYSIWSRHDAVCKQTWENVIQDCKAQTQVQQIHDEKCKTNYLEAPRVLSLLLLLNAVTTLRIPIVRFSCVETPSISIREHPLLFLMFIWMHYTQGYIRFYVFAQHGFVQWTCTGVWNHGIFETWRLYNRHKSSLHLAIHLEAQPMHRPLPHYRLQQ